jgi:hypothetical protein
LLTLHLVFKRLCFLFSWIRFQYVIQILINTLKIFFFVIYISSWWLFEHFKVVSFVLTMAIMTLFLWVSTVIYQWSVNHIFIIFDKIVSVSMHYRITSHKNTLFLFFKLMSTLHYFASFICKTILCTSFSLSIVTVLIQIWISITLKNTSCIFWDIIMMILISFWLTRAIGVHSLSISNHTLRKLTLSFLNDI